MQFQSLLIVEGDEDLFFPLPPLFKFRQQRKLGTYNKKFRIQKLFKNNDDDDNDDDDDNVDDDDENDDDHNVF